MTVKSFLSIDDRVRLSVDRGGRAGMDLGGDRRTDTIVLTKGRSMKGLKI